MNASFSNQACAPRRFAAGTLALMMVAGLCGAMGPGTAQAAVTTGRVFGHAPAGATVVASDPDHGIQRRSTANAEGRYLITWLPLGAYTVTVLDNGQPAVEHPDVQLVVDHGSRVDFGCPYGQCAEVAAN
jgi:hypothetical protein